MPFRSGKQRRFMWANHPKIASRWTKTYGSKVQPKTATKSTKSKKK